MELPLILSSIYRIVLSKVIVTVVIIIYKFALLHLLPCYKTGKNVGMIIISFALELA